MHTEGGASIHIDKFPIAILSSIFFFALFISIRQKRMAKKNESIAKMLFDTTMNKGGQIRQRCKKKTLQLILFSCQKNNKTKNKLILEHEKGLHVKLNSSHATSMSTRKSTNDIFSLKMMTNLGRFSLQIVKELKNFHVTSRDAIRLRLWSCRKASFCLSYFPQLNIGFRSM